MLFHGRYFNTSIQSRPQRRHLIFSTIAKKKKKYYSFSVAQKLIWEGPANWITVIICCLSRFIKEQKQQRTKSYSYRLTRNKNLNVKNVLKATNRCRTTTCEINQNWWTKSKYENKDRKRGFYSRKFCNTHEKRQVAALQISKQYATEYSKKHLETTVCQMTKCKY